MLHAVVPCTTRANSHYDRPRAESRGDPSPALEATMIQTPTTVPALTDLLKDSPTNWGKWGDDDEVGALNYLGPEQVLAAVKLVSTGRAFRWHGRTANPRENPVWPARTPAGRTQILVDSAWAEAGRGPATPGGRTYPT